MSLDERGRRAAEDLRAHLVDDLPTLEMLTSLQRTRGRRRLALAVPVAAAAVAVVAALTSSPAHDVAGPSDRPGPSAPTSATTAGPTSPTRGNGVLFGVGEKNLRAPRGVYSPVLHDGSSPTWSPDGDEIAVLDGGILVTEAYTGAEHRLPCPECSEIAWSPDGRSFAAPGVDGHPLGLVDASTGTVTPVPLDRVQAVRSVTWSPDGAQLAFLATSPSSAQGAYTANRDGSDLTLVVDYPTVLAQASGDRATMLAVRWAPTWDRFAVLFAQPATPAGYEGELLLSVLTYRSDGSGVNHLLNLGRCACVGFQPNLVWSPDGTTLAVYAQHARADRRSLDGDGREIRIRFLNGSGPLSWQPLPLVS
jgi:hypothetical protein